MGVKGEGELKFWGFFPIGLCGLWSVTCPMQLGDLDQRNDGKDHLFIEQSITDSMAVWQIGK